jgi:uncharacterized protein YwgA
MSLLFEHRWEHAVVGAVIDAAKQSCPSCYLGRTAIQKLVYFLKVLGVPMLYSFRIHHFGPYCDDVTSTLDWLQADGIVVDQSNKPRYSDFAPGGNWRAVRELHSEALEQYQSAIETVVNALGAMEPRTLELISTLDYSYRWVRAQGGHGPWKERTVQKLKQIKGEKFDGPEIDQWFGQLVTLGLIEH